MSNLIRVSEAAKTIGVSASTIRTLINNGIFPGARKIDPSAKNSHWMIPESEIKSYINENNKPESIPELTIDKECTDKYHVWRWLSASLQDDSLPNDDLLCVCGKVAWKDR